MRDLENTRTRSHIGLAAWLLSFGVGIESGDQPRVREARAQLRRLGVVVHLRRRLNGERDVAVAVRR